MTDAVEAAFQRSYKAMLYGDRLWRGEQGKHFPSKADVNPTLNGVTQKAFTDLGYPGNVMDMTPEQQEAIYRRYWQDGKSDKLATLGFGNLALAHHFTFFNTSPKSAMKILQRAVGMKGPDGIFGPRTLDAIAAVENERDAIVRYCGILIRFYRDICVEKPHLAPNLKGWEARVDFIQRATGLTPSKAD